MVTPTAGKDGPITVWQDKSCLYQTHLAKVMVTPTAGFLDGQITVWQDKSCFYQTHLAKVMATPTAGF